jgi:hypothetical protein
MKKQVPIACQARRYDYEIELRAYELWLSAGRPLGSDREYWLQAEAELLRAAPAHVRRVPASGRSLPAGVGPQ